VVRANSVDDREQVVLAHDHVVFAGVLDVGAGVGGEQDAIANADGEGALAAIFEGAAVTEGKHDAFLGLFLGAFGQQDAAGGFVFGFDALNEQAITQGADGDVLLGLGLGGRGEDSLK